ncbi:hypothetical protein GCM10023317_07250 [Actinopolymorpha pittospori]|uniref:Uncharacterized protein n=1 Tax=Actinopolymorpha pittospori TaxID=648752 RepID=A0A927MYB3_9ACTN|nr:hypothetical protein [Actinopolymorpha pittospori]
MSERRSPCAHAQVDRGGEGNLLGHVGVGNVYSFHMTMAYSRDPFTCFTTSMDLAIGPDGADCDDFAVDLQMDPLATADLAGGEGRVEAGLERDQRVLAEPAQVLVGDQIRPRRRWQPRCLAYSDAWKSLSPRTCTRTLGVTGDCLNDSTVAWKGPHR